MAESPETAAAATGTEEDRKTVRALIDGDIATFEALVDAHHVALVRLAAQYVGSDSVAEEVAQEAWVAFLYSLSRFEYRSRLKTWLFRTLVNCARNRRRKEAHTIPFSAFFDPNKPEQENLEDLRSPRGRGAESGPSRGFGEDGEQRLLRGELALQLTAAVLALPPAQREVITLRDIEGFEAEEVCATLGISEANQRVLLHRARGRVRAALQSYLDTG
jgi:RNA polymerase sigma-70 factor (ECF subfamily)